MHVKQSFGSIVGSSINIGDLVSWSEWSISKRKWIKIYGIVIDVYEKTILSSPAIFVKVYVKQGYYKEMSTFSVTVVSKKETKECV